MSILIVTTSEKCIAEYALRAEGYWPEVTRIHEGDMHAYGRTLAKYWLTGEPFINVEHDMAPWVGAVNELWECDQELCLFPYPRATSGSLGMIRFSAGLIDRFPGACDRWPTTSWNMLEQAVLGYFKNVNRHLHYPPVAHLSGWYR